MKKVVAIKLIPLRVGFRLRTESCNFIFIVVSVVLLGVYLCPIMPFFVISSERNCCFICETKFS